MMRTFDPQVANDEPADTDSKPEQCRNVAVNSLIEEFFSSGVNNFLNLDNKSSDIRLKQLAGIATRAARLSYRLWTQKTRLSILGLEDLGLGGDDEVKTFEDRAELLHYHAYHNVEHSRDNGCLDGKPIVMITHPAVIAYGDSSGDNYAEYKVWKKAEAWMG